MQLKQFNSIATMGFCASSDVGIALYSSILLLVDGKVTEFAIALALKSKTQAQTPALQSGTDIFNSHVL